MSSLSLSVAPSSLSRVAASSLSRSVAACVALAAACLFATVASAAPLRICADPDDLPFSNQSGRGFDNHIAMLVAQRLHREPVFVWARSRRGFLREQFNRGACDILFGVPVGAKGLATSTPYYRSSYVFVTPVREQLDISSFRDPRLNGRRIGLQILEEDMAPPSLPLIRYGHAAQLVGFHSFGSGPEQLLRAVATRNLGAAVVWGPIAGYFADRDRLPLRLTAVSPAVDPATHIPFAFDMAAGLHKKDAALLAAVNAALHTIEPQVRHTLAAYHVPLEPPAPSASAAASLSARAGGEL